MRLFVCVSTEDLKHRFPLNSRHLPSHTHCGLVYEHLRRTPLLRHQESQERSVTILEPSITSVKTGSKHDVTPVLPLPTLKTEITENFREP